MASLLARRLRKTATEAEIRLWSRLRHKQVDGFRFRRQQPIGPYIADFYCSEASLVIEVDGGQHGPDEASDSARDQWLKARGYRVLRFWNNEVLANTDGVVSAIRTALRS